MYNQFFGMNNSIKNKLTSKKPKNWDRNKEYIEKIREEIRTFKEKNKLNTGENDGNV